MCFVFLENICIIYNKQKYNAFCDKLRQILTLCGQTSKMTYKSDRLNLTRL